MLATPIEGAQPIHIFNSLKTCVRWRCLHPSHHRRHQQHQAASGVQRRHQPLEFLQESNRFLKGVHTENTAESILFQRLWMLIIILSYLFTQAFFQKVFKKYLSSFWCFQDGSKISWVSVWPSVINYISALVKMLSV